MDELFNPPPQSTEKAIEPEKPPEAEKPAEPTEQVDVTASFQKMRQALEVVFQMRKAQKNYFTTRKQDDLIASKRLEAAVDLRLAELAIR